MKKLKSRKEGSREKQGRAAPAPTKAGPSSSPLQWLIAIAFIAVAAAGSYAAFHYYILSRVPNAMVGTWVVIDVKTKEGAKADESLKGGTLEFRRDGTMIGKVNMDGKEGKIKAAVEVEGEILRITSVNPNNGQKVTDEQTIRTLEGDRFVIEDRKGTVLMMERLRE